MATPLENPRENPCFGCGPEHARGLHLEFSRDGDAVVCAYTPKPDEIGWPGLFHTGLHFTVLFEACYWAALEITGKVHVAAAGKPQTYSHERLPRVGQPFHVRARIARREGATLVMEAESRRADGKPIGRSVGHFEPASRAAVERSGIQLPRYLLDEMAP